MAEVVENTENTENETPAVPQMSTVERAEMLLKQDATIREKIKSGATLDEAVDPSNKEFGPLAHPEQVQMRVAKRAMMLEAGIAPYPVHLDVTDTIEAVRAKYDGKLEAGEETEDMARFILDVRDEWGVTVLMVEHDMGMVMDLSDHVVVLNFGQVIAQGQPAAVQGNPEVIKAYLGSGDVHDLRRKLHASTPANAAGVA